MKRRKAVDPIHAAGGIVIRGHRDPRIAIVQLRKDDSWVLPKGKLNRNESALAAARREVLEEVGHKVYIHEFLGTIAYEVGTRPKVVQFWRMQAVGDPVGPLMSDVKAVAWSKLGEAVDRLTHSREKVFLRNVGPVALEAAERSARRARSGEPAAPATFAEAIGEAADTGGLAGVHNLPDRDEAPGPSPKQQVSGAAADQITGIDEPIGGPTDQKVSNSAAEPPRGDCNNATGPLAHGVVQRVIQRIVRREWAWLRGFAHRLATWMTARRHIPARGAMKVGVNRHGRHDEAAQEGDQAGA